MNREYSETTCTSNLKLHVSGFAPHVNSCSIVKYFSKFGRVYIDLGSYYSSGYGSGRQELSKLKVEQYRKRKNYLIIGCEDFATKEAILQFQGHRFQGCSIFCNEYKTGYDLILHNQRVNQRRCILRKVPISFTRDEIVETIEREAGPIESLYVYEPLKCHKMVRHYSVSITFCTNNSLDILLTAAAEKGIYFYDQRISVERYGTMGKNSSENIIPTRSTKPSLIFSNEITYPKFEAPLLPANVTSIGMIPHPLKIHESKPVSRQYHLARIRSRQNHSGSNIRLNLCNRV